MIPYVEIHCDHGCPAITVPEKYRDLERCWRCGGSVTVRFIKGKAVRSLPAKILRQIKRAEALKAVPKAPDGRPLY